MNVDVRAEAASVLTMAADVGWTLGRLEEGIASCRGNVDSIFKVCLLCRCDTTKPLSQY